MLLQHDVSVLMSYGIKGLTKKIAENTCSKYSLNDLSELYLEDNSTLLFALMNIEGITPELAEKILYFVGINLVEVGDIVREVKSSSFA